MDYEEFVKKSDELVAEMRATDDPAKKAELKKAWFENAVDVFNTEIAGEITLADGRKMTILEL